MQYSESAPIEYTKTLSLSDMEENENLSPIKVWQTTPHSSTDLYKEIFMNSDSTQPQEPADGRHVMEYMLHSLGSNPNVNATPYGYVEPVRHKKKKRNRSKAKAAKKARRKNRR